MALARIIHDGSSRCRGAVWEEGVLVRYVDRLSGEPAGRRLVAAANRRLQ